MNRFFLQIFNTAITAGWLVLAVLLARLLLKKAPAWIKCGLWAIVGLRLVWPFEIESVLSAVPSTQTIPPAALYDPVPEVHTGISYLNSAINPGFAQTFQPVPSASVNPLQVATTVAAWVWIAGVIAMLAYMAYSYLRLRHLVVVRMSAGEGVYLCDRVESPFILGFIRPKIYLPSDLPKEKWDSILAHEQAHIARRDHWWKPLGFLLLTVFWFHPLLWLAYILLCRDVELACDEKVIRGLSPEEKQRYSQTLLECSMPRKWITACPLAFGEVGVKERVKNVLNYKKPSFWIILIALIVCTVVAVCFLTDPVDPTDVLADTQTVLCVEGGPHSISGVSYQPQLEGYFRITEAGVLQYYNYGKEDSNMAPGWHDVGTLEERTVSEIIELDHIETDLHYVFPVDAGKVQKIWRIDGKEGCLGCVCYLSQMKNGDWYFSMFGFHLFNLTERELPIEYEFELVGKSFLYEGEGAGSLFSITLHEDGRATYYEGVYSSHMGVGTWEVKDGKLYIHEGVYSGTNTYAFQVEADALVYIAEESDRFIYVDVADGEKFRYFTNLPQPTQPLQLMWVEIESYGDGYLYALDSYGNRWKVNTNAPLDVLSLAWNQCWVSYYGEPDEIHTQLPDGSMVRYEITAERCWVAVERPSELPKDAQMLTYGDVPMPIFDYCWFDIDKDGADELCVVSAGKTSGVPTFQFSVWEDGECQYGQQLYGYNGVALVKTQYGLSARTSDGVYYSFVYQDGSYSILENGLPYP